MELQCFGLVTLVSKNEQIADESRWCDFKIRGKTMFSVGGYIKHIEECVCLLLEVRISESRVSATAV